MISVSRGECWRISRDGNDRLVVQFHGYTPTDDLRKCLRALSGALPAKDGHVIVDLREIDGHNPEVRDPWKSWIQQHKSRLASIDVVITNTNVVTRMVVGALGLATGVRMRLLTEPPVD